MQAHQKKVLTDRTMQALAPREDGRRYIVWDAIQPLFGVRVSRTGVLTFLVVKRRPGAKHSDYVKLGRYPTLSLAKARDAARDALGLLERGKRPADVEAERLREEDRKRQDTFESAVQMFLEDQAHRKLRSAKGTEACLRREFLGQTWRHEPREVERDGQKVIESITVWSPSADAVWSKRPVNQITRRDIVERLDVIKRRGGQHAARHALGGIRKFFNWCAEGERYGIEISPCANVRDKTLGIVGRDLRRKRVLTDIELRDVWSAAQGFGYPFGSVVQLLMLTGQRLNDIAQASRGDEIDLGAATLTVSPERYKTGIAHEVPLPPLALEIFSAGPKFFRDAFAFSTTNGTRPISGFSKWKERLDATIGERRANEGRAPMPGWVLHDLRRTVRTRLVSDLGVDAYTAERVIGHAMPGLHAVYDQGTHRDQKRAALQKWEARLLDIVGFTPTPTNVVQADEVERRRRKRG